MTSLESILISAKRLLSRLVDRAATGRSKIPKGGTAESISMPCVSHVDRSMALFAIVRQSEEDKKSSLSRRRMRFASSMDSADVAGELRTRSIGSLHSGNELPEDVGVPIYS